jgi:predicted adenylyl cyclase CyaB
MSVSEPRRNLELKARDPDPDRSVAACAAVGAIEEGIREQSDTYFEVAAGRLKLREEPGGVAELIAYQRPDEPQSRESRYWRVPVGDPVELRAALASTLGVKAVVAKHRRLYRLDGAQIHLDDVQGLGSFIEFELDAPLDSDLLEQQQRLSELRQAFQIDDRDLVAGSYSDLVLLARG